jgi:class 3 adenylate cyclase
VQIGDPCVAMIRCVRGYEGRATAGSCYLRGSPNAWLPDKMADPRIKLGDISSHTGTIDVPPVGPFSDGERKTVTALFVDIKSSVELMIGMDAEEAQSIIDPALHLMGGALLLYDGYIVHTLGDGIFALSGAPIAYEDHARRAVYAALDLQRELKAYAHKLERQGRHRLEARIGINTGDVILRTLNTGGRAEYNPIGHTVNLAARLQTIAPATSILIGEQTRMFVDGYFDLRALVSLTLKGIPEPVTAFEVLGLSELRRNLQVSIRRGLTKLIGRDDELKQLDKSLETVDNGHSTRVLICAEAGAGKSRLLFEFVSKVPDSYRVLESYGISHLTFTPLSPIIFMLQDVFGIGRSDDADERRRKVRHSLSELSIDLRESMPYICELFGLDTDDQHQLLTQMHPQIKRRRTFHSIGRVLSAVSARQPLISIFEDLHWMDSQSLEFILWFGSRKASERILLIATSRSATLETGIAVEKWEEIHLRPLQAAEADELLTVLDPSDRYSRGMRDQIIVRSAGNPFFMEEIVRSLLETTSSAQTSRRDKVDLPTTHLKVPATVEATLAARIDKLSLKQKSYCKRWR